MATLRLGSKPWFGPRAGYPVVMNIVSRAVGWRQRLPWNHTAKSGEQTTPRQR